MIRYPTKGKEKIEQLPFEQFLQRFEVFSGFLRVKQLGEKRGKFQKVVEIAHNTFSL